MKLTVCKMIYIGVILIGFVQSSPVKVSRPQAITVANLTNKQIQAIIQESPTRPSILQPNDQVLPPSIALYLPDPERNKSTDDFYLLAPYGPNEKSSSSSNDDSSLGNIASLLSLDTLVRPPPLPSPDSQPIDFHSDQMQAKKDNPSYSYNDRYDYYFPVKVVYDDNEKYGEQEIKMMELQPPSPSNEPNYYDVKPKKVPKKYQPNKKHVNIKSNGRVGNSDNDDDNYDDKLIPIDNDGLVLDSEHQPFVTSQPVERFAPAPSYRDLTDADLNTGEYIPKYKYEQNTEAISLPLDAAGVLPHNRGTPHHLLKSGSQSNAKKFVSSQSSSEENDNYQTTHAHATPHAAKLVVNDANKRVEFQMHGFNGPNSYKFGYDTGLGEERQFRIEQREGDGSIKGEYGYVDKEGKMHLTKYRASEAEGFKAEEVST